MLEAISKKRKYENVEPVSNTFKVSAKGCMFWSWENEKMISLKDWKEKSLNPGMFKFDIRNSQQVCLDIFMEKGAQSIYITLQVLKNAANKDVIMINRIETIPNSKDMGFYEGNFVLLFETIKEIYPSLSILITPDIYNYVFVEHYTIIKTYLNFYKGFTDKVKLFNSKLQKDMKFYKHFSNIIYLTYDEFKKNYKSYLTSKEKLESDSSFAPEIFKRTELYDVEGVSEISPVKYFDDMIYNVYEKIDPAEVFSRQVLSLKKYYIFLIYEKDDGAVFIQLFHTTSGIFNYFALDFIESTKRGLGEEAIVKLCDIFNEINVDKGYVGVRAPLGYSLWVRDIYDTVEAHIFWEKIYIKYKETKNITFNNEYELEMSQFKNGLVDKIISRLQVLQVNTDDIEKIKDNPSISVKDLNILLNSLYEIVILDISKSSEFAKRLVDDFKQKYSKTETKERMTINAELTQVKNRGPDIDKFDRIEKFNVIDYAGYNGFITGIAIKKNEKEQSWKLLIYQEHGKHPMEPKEFIIHKSSQARISNIYKINNLNKLIKDIYQDYGNGYMDKYI